MESSPISQRIEASRDRLVTIAGLVVALGNLAAWSWNRLHLPLGTDPDPTNSWLTLTSAAVGLLAAGLARLKRRRLASALLAAGLTLLTTLMVLRFGLSYEIALAAYVGVLLVTIVGNRKAEAILTTALVVAIGLAVFWARPGQRVTVQGMLAIGGLLSAIGITLAWLQDSLLNAIGQLELSQARLHRLSHLDPLTALGNRRLFDESLVQQLRYSSVKRPLTLVLIDVDKLKSINDRHGHPIGDRALQLVADSIRATTRESDAAARIGGDEFGILLPTGGLKGGRLVAERIHQLLEEWRQDGRNGMDLTVSIGVAEASDPNFGVEALLASADKDMYAGRTGPTQSP